MSEGRNIVGHIHSHERRVRDLVGTNSFKYYQRALDHNYLSGGYYLDKLYTFGGKLPRDIRRARDLFENCLEAKAEPVGCNNRPGEIYFYGGDGVEVDYNKTFHQGSHYL